MIGNRQIQIKAEAGFLEIGEYLCCFPPGIRPLKILKETYPLIDESYDPIVNPWKESFENESLGGYDACINRIKNTIEVILNKYKGDIVIISHGSLIAELLEILTGTGSYVGEATVSKLVEKENGKFEALYIANQAHLSDKKNKMFSKFAFLAKFGF
uniref:Phosphoglycerate mutase n=1 Tax=Panagrolaimus sp. ES5 TaxID=591445 RepID=A0AC34FC86_9BILA